MDAHDDLISESNRITRGARANHPITRQERLHCDDAVAYSSSGPKLICGVLGAGAIG
jgi:hypothetical protein